jgi:hypothetical protein
VGEPRFGSHVLPRGAAAVSLAGAPHCEATHAARRRSIHT